MLRKFNITQTYEIHMKLTQEKTPQFHTYISFQMTFFVEDKLRFLKGLTFETKRDEIKPVNGFV